MYPPDNSELLTVAQRAPSPPLLTTCAVQQSGFFAGRHRTLSAQVETEPCHRATLQGLLPELLDMIGSYLNPGELRNLALSSREIAAKLNPRPYVRALQCYGRQADSRDRGGDKEYLYPLCNRFSAASPERYHMKTMWFGWLDGWVQCRAGPVAVLPDSGSHHIEFQQFDPVRGITATVALPVFINRAPIESEHEFLDRVKNEGVRYLYVHKDFFASYANHTETWLLRRNRGLCLVTQASVPVPLACCCLDIELNGCTVTAAGTINGDICLCDFTGNRGILHTVKLHRAKMVGLLSVQGGDLVSASQDGVLHMWKPSGCTPLACHRLPETEELHQITEVNDNHFLSHSGENERKLWRLWQVGQGGFACIALLAPQVSGTLQSGSRLEQACRGVQCFYQGSATGKKVRVAVQDQNRIISIINGRDGDLSGQQEPTTLELYDLNRPPPPSKVTAKWSNPNTGHITTVPVLEPLVLPALLCDDKALLVKSLKDGPLLVVSCSGRVVLYHFDSGKIQELIYRPGSDNETLIAAFLGKDNFIWLCGATGTLFVLDPHLTRK